ncbi:MAG: hypothetical protein INR64_06910 [Caulobacteraceae bacterium]|nr:hypothetical protein [Caulobacter sp.]
MTRYCVHACDDDPRHEHLIVAASATEAAVLFVERWRASATGEAQVELELRDLDGGGVSHVTLDLAA